jgi:hypothetical protein
MNLQSLKRGKRTKYDPQPPFNSGSLETASAETSALVKSVLGS